MTNDVEELRALLERVEAATEPDRELDARIKCAIENLEWFGPISYYGVNNFFGKSRDYPYDAVYVFQEPQNAPVSVIRYTSSIDAALALIERELPGWFWEVCRQTTWEDKPDFFASIASQAFINDQNNTDTGEGMAASPALATLSALLRAKIAQAESEVT